MKPKSFGPAKPRECCNTCKHIVRREGYDESGRFSIAGMGELTCSFHKFVLQTMTYQPQYKTDETTCKDWEGR